MIKLAKLKPNEKNPRTISEAKLEQLKKSVLGLEKMMELRPIVVDENFIILGGNMRFKALNELGHTEIPNNWVKVAKGLTETEKKEFIIKDNVGFGEWDWDILANEWESEELGDWGLDVWTFETKVDYSILEDNEGIDQQLEEMTKGVKRAIQIEFEADFPYQETVDQLSSIEDIKKDMESTMPMDRLLCGDVGYGKTEVAMRASFKAVLDKKQVAILVPTTVLAFQHFNSFIKRFNFKIVKSSTGANSPVSPVSIAS